MKSAVFVAVSALSAQMALAQDGAFPLQQLEAGRRVIPTAISADGAVIGGMSGDPAREDGLAALWQASTREGGLIGRPGAQGAARFSRLSADGNIGLVETRYHGSMDHSYWTADLGFQDFALGSGWDKDHWDAWGLSRDGHTVVGSAYVTGVGTRAVEWVDGVPNELPHDPAWHSSGASFVGPTGSIYGTIQRSDDFGTDRAAVWKHGAPTELFAITDSLRGLAVAASGDDSIVLALGVDQAFNSTSYQWTPQTGLVELESPRGWNYTVVLAASDDASVAAGFTWNTNTFEEDAAVWINGIPWSFGDYLTSRGLDTRGITFTSLSAVSADGRTFVGQGYDPLGKSVGFVAIVPAPGPLAAFGLAVLGTQPRRRAPGRRRG